MDEYNKQVNEAQNKLSTIMTAINRENLILEEKRKDNQDLQIEIAKNKEEFDIAKEETKKANQEKDIAKENLIDVQNQIRKEEGILQNIKVKNKEAEIEHVELKTKNTDELSILKDQKEDFINNFEETRNKLNKEIRLLNETKDLISEQILVKEKTLKSLALQEELDLKKSENMKTVLSEDIIKKESIESEILRLNNELVDTESNIKKNKDKIESLRIEVAGKEAEKENIQNDINKLEESRSEFVQAKMILQSDKEELTNRELFIISKYEQAGLPYNNEKLQTTKNSIASMAEFQQLKEDLDKREKFIKDKYLKAGIEYL